MRCQEVWRSRSLQDQMKPKRVEGSTSTGRVMGLTLNGVLSKYRYSYLVYDPSY